ncbi:hypothetical protein H5410_052041 [Solanum commersonii]|uniref:Uncharacterized protein n=1 Tax=Solanum commersonii TaxID=4109 RepID=A0A9J5X2H6_SOLCO|nr:hypothetical protein H5410_052041 [Solanum commersonii]
MAFSFNLVPKTMLTFPSFKPCLLKTIIAMRCMATTRRPPPRPPIKTKPPQNNNFKDKKETVMIEEKSSIKLQQDNSMVKAN